jgi:hypothetical protein
VLGVGVSGASVGEEWVCQKSVSRGGEEWVCQCRGVFGVCVWGVLGGRNGCVKEGGCVSVGCVCVSVQGRNGCVKEGVCVSVGGVCVSVQGRNGCGCVR